MFGCRTPGCNARPPLPLVVVSQKKTLLGPATEEYQVGNEEAGIKAVHAHMGTSMSPFSSLLMCSQLGWILLSAPAHPTRPLFDEGRRTPALHFSWTAGGASGIPLRCRGGGTQSSARSPGQHASASSPRTIHRGAAKGESRRRKAVNGADKTGSAQPDPQVPAPLELLGKEVRAGMTPDEMGDWCRVWLPPGVRRSLAARLLPWRPTAWRGHHARSSPAVSPRREAQPRRVCTRRCSISCRRSSRRSKCCWTAPTAARRSSPRSSASAS